ncbi:OmpA family protein [Spirosoma arcticum]
MTSIAGSIVDAATNQPVAGATVLARNQAGKVNAQQRVGPDGTYRLSLSDSKQEYSLVMNAAGYESHEERVAFTTTTTIATQLIKRPTKLYRIGTKPASATTVAVALPASTSSAEAATPLPEATVTAPATVVQPDASPAISARPSPRLTPPKTLDAKVVYTPPLVVAAPGKTTQLRAIQFVQSKAELLPDAQPALEQLATFLKSNPTTEIELGGHTDNQGDFDENLRLSKQRVEVVKAYLVTNGIAANRIVTRGYGPTRPIGSNNAENTRQLNRRVEMTVLKQ